MTMVWLFMLFAWIGFLAGWITRSYLTAEAYRRDGIHLACEEYEKEMEALSREMETGMRK